MRCKILVVDDEEAILEEAAEALTIEGYECFQAENVDAALTLLRGDPGIALVVTDLKMPGKSGIDLIEQARREFRRDIKFIVMSGHGSVKDEDLVTCGIGRSGSGEPSFLRKPLDIGEFLEAVGKQAASISGQAEDGGANGE